MKYVVCLYACTANRKSTKKKVLNYALIAPTMTERPSRGDRARERVRRDGVTARRAQPSKLAVLAATGRRNDVLPQQASEREKKALSVATAVLRVVSWAL